MLALAQPKVKLKLLPRKHGIDKIGSAETCRRLLQS
jgi:hypothetical protein